MRSRAQILIAALSIAALPPQPPAIVHAGGAFAATRLAQPPAIDGREWIATSAAPVSKPGKVTVNAKTLALTARDCGGDHGDFERCQLLLRRGGQAVRIGAGWTGWVFVTPDERYVVTEPLDVLDVRAWKQYRLSEALGIPNYTSIAAISRDGQRLLVSRTDCPMDCGTSQTFEYYVLRLPPAPTGSMKNSAMISRRRASDSALLIAVRRWEPFSSPFVYHEFNARSLLTTQRSWPRAAVSWPAPGAT